MIQDEELDAKQIELWEEETEYLLRQQKEEQDRIPKIIFRYRPAANCNLVERCCDIFENNRLYMPSFSDLNDPFEGWSSKFLAKNKSIARAKTLEKYRVLCFSSEALSTTQWAHYADNYKGIAIGFWSNSSFKDINSVTYASGHQGFYFGDKNVFRNDLFIKNEEWSVEKEWRMVTAPANEAEKDKYFYFNPKDIACVLIGNKICGCAKKHILSKIPDYIPVFNLEVDTENLYLCAVNGSLRATNTEELLKIIFNLKMEKENEE